MVTTVRFIPNNFQLYAIDGIRVLSYAGIPLCGCAGENAYVEAMDGWMRQTKTRPALLDVAEDAASYEELTDEELEVPESQAVIKKGLEAKERLRKVRIKMDALIEKGLKASGSFTVPITITYLKDLKQ